MKSISMSDPWITDHEVAVVMDAMRNGWSGDKKYYYCETFEAEFAEYHDRTHALMTPNCTSALHLLLAGLGIAEGDEVIVPECTWIASSAPIHYQRAETVFADIDPKNWCLAASAIEDRITERTKAVIVVDLFGSMPDMDVLRGVTERRGIHLVEDAAEALGSTYKGVRAGKFGVGSVFSFHRTKTITTGEGGMLLLDDDDLYERCKLLRDHGRLPGDWVNTEVAFKYMPFNLQAAMGHAQFQRIEELLEKKRWIWNGYKERLADIPDLRFNPEPEHVRNGAWITALVFGPRHRMTGEMAMAALAERNLPSRPFFHPLSSLPAYGARVQWGRQHNPMAYDVSERGIVLPSGFSIDDGQLDRMCDGIRKVLGH